jgi:hypothetical protein
MTKNNEIARQRRITHLAEKNVSTCIADIKGMPETDPMFPALKKMAHIFIRRYVSELAVLKSMTETQQ